MLKKIIIAGILITVLAFLGGCTPAQTTDTNSNSMLPLIGIMVAIFALFYFTSIRPQRKRQKTQQEEHQKMMLDLQRGDKVVVAGVIFGTIDSISEDTIILKMESGATMKVAKSFVTKLPK
jgi:preprotein translocase subunit YajC